MYKHWLTFKIRRPPFMLRVYWVSVNWRFLVKRVIKAKSIDESEPMKDYIYVKSEEGYEDMIHHRSYTHNLSSFEIKVWEGFELMAAAITVLCSTNWATKYTGSWRRYELFTYNCDDQSCRHIVDLLRSTHYRSATLSKREILFTKSFSFDFLYLLLIL